MKELDAVGWAIRLAKRLESLHALGVAHGSISPACVLTAGVERTCKACLADVQLTTSNPAFQSPERLLGGDISPADDTWAVAATLYAFLTGKGPFAGPNEAETRQKILGSQPPPLAVHDVGDDDLQHILDHAFAREISARTTTVAALRSALEEWHPDPSVGALLPLDDEEPTDGDELDEAETVMRLNPVYIPRRAADDDDDDMRAAMRMPSPPTRSPSPSPSPSPRHATPPAALAPPDDDDDLDNVRTMMREPGALIGAERPNLEAPPPNLSPPKVELMGEKTLAFHPDEPPVAPVEPPPAGFSGVAEGGPVVSPWAPTPERGPIIVPAPRRSTLGMVIAAVLAVLIAAAITFVFMRYRIRL